MFNHIHYNKSVQITDIQYQSINQSNFYRANIPGEARLSGCEIEWLEILQETFNMLRCDICSYFTALS